MSNTQRNIGIIILSLGIVALVVYGYFASRQVDNNRTGEIESNIQQYIKDSLPDLPEFDDDEEDLDGEEATVEDDDFETYQEPEENNWPEEDTIIINESPTAISASLPEAKAKPSNASYWVIAGSFKSRNNARKKRKLLKDLKFPAAIVFLPNSKLHSVRVNQFDNEISAQELVDQLAAEYEINAIIKPIDDSKK